MTITRKNLFYLMYCTMVLASFLQSIDIAPYAVKFIFNKVFYFTVVVCLAISIQSQKISISRNMQLPTKLLLAFAFFYTFANFYNNETGWLASSIGNGIFYFLTFLAIHFANREIPLEKLFAPFAIIICILIALSLAMMMGLPLQYFNTDENAVDYYIANKSSLSLAVLSGVYLNQNAFVVLAFMGVAVFLMQYQFSKQAQKKIIKYFYIAMVIIALLCALMTLSRAGILACTVLLFLYFLKILKNKSGFFFLLLAGMMSLAVMYFFSDYFDQLISRVENDGSSHRVEIWEDAFDVFKENYLFGAGDYKYYTPNGHLTSHNIYIQLLASQGIIASLCWFGFLLSFLLPALKNISKTKMEIEPLAVISSIVFFAILVHQSFETMIIGASAPLVLFMFLLMGGIKNTNIAVSGRILKNA